MRKSGKLFFDYTSKRSFLIENGIQGSFIRGPVKCDLCFLCPVKAMSDAALRLSGSVAGSQLPEPSITKAEHSLWRNSHSPSV